MNTFKAEHTKSKRCSNESLRLGAGSLGRLENEIQDDIRLRQKSVYFKMLLKLKPAERAAVQEWIDESKEGISEYEVGYESYFIANDKVDPKAIQAAFCGTN